MKKNSNKGKTITVKIKYDDFTQETRSKTIDKYISKKEDFLPIIELYKPKKLYLFLSNSFLLNLILK